MIFKYIKYQLLTLFILGGSHVFSQANLDYNQLKLSEAIEIGLQNNKKLKIRSLQTEIAELHERDLLNDKLPDVNFHTSFYKLSTLRQFEHGILNRSTQYDVPGEQYDFTLSAEIPIYLGGKLKNDEKKAAIEVDIKKLQVRKDERELRMEIITAYLKVLHLKEQQLLIEDKMHEDTLVIKQTKALKKNGAVTYNEVLRTELQLSNHKISHSELSKEIDILEHHVKTILAIHPEHEVHIDTSDLITSTDHIGLVDDMILEALGNSEKLKISEKDVRLKEIDKKITRANILPKITAGGKYGYTYPNFMFFPPEEFMYRFGMVGVNVSIPISNFFKNKQKMQIANQNISIAKLEVEEREEEIIHDVFVANKRLEDAIEKIEIAKEAINQSKENYRIVKTKYINKLSLITELIDADNSLLEAQSNMISLQINKQLKYYQLQYVLGNL
ncbi:TolC family protein [Faecalibacter rhinopitheci]|uniref:TolC family protein n=1 Tax=Faecalibacter rhinopitheci TaxID=2779678 RepID=A0A8J7FN95_9FLAO|nr:TolC family protein [Faecalibacter rhinopitheci]MBF0596174.1 TolC family protein [Faecalibacter rhinopitheci]